MTFLTKTIKDRLLANAAATEGAIENETEQPDHFPVLKLFHPWGLATWLLTELDTDNDTAFGLCDLGMGCPELGTVSLLEIADTLPSGLRIERDQHWTASHPISVYARAASRAGRIVTDRASLDAAAKEVR